MYMEGICFFFPLSKFDFHDKMSEKISRSGSRESSLQLSVSRILQALGSTVSLYEMSRWSTIPISSP